MHKITKYKVTMIEDNETMVIYDSSLPWSISITEGEEGYCKLEEVELELDDDLDIVNERVLETLFTLPLLPF